MTSDRTSTTPDLYVRKVRGMGRGVFAGRPFRQGEVIEVCPVIPLPDADGHSAASLIFSRNGSAG